MAVSQKAHSLVLLVALSLLCGLLCGCNVQQTSEESKQTNKRRIMIILAPPCGGCGTQSPNIVKTLGIPHVDTGNLLRQASALGTPAGKLAGKIMKEGGLVPEHITNAVIADRIKQPDCAKGFLLDGYPRNEAEAVALDKMLAATGESVTDVLELRVPMVGLQQCVTHRWTADGGDEWTSDYLAFRVPKSLKRLPAGTKAQCEPNDLENCNMWDDWTGEPLYRRADDNLNTLAERVKVYYAQTYPVFTHYKPLHVTRHVNGYQPVEKVWADMEVALGLPPSPDLGATSTPGLAAMSATEPLTALAAISLTAAGASAIVVTLLARSRPGDMSEPLL